MLRTEPLLRRDPLIPGRTNAKATDAALAALFERSVREAKALAARDRSSPRNDPRALRARPGDTLWDIAIQRHLTLKRLLAANPQFDPAKADGVLEFDRRRRGQWDPDYLRPGDLVRLPAQPHKTHSGHPTSRRAAGGPLPDAKSAAPPLDDRRPVDAAPGAKSTPPETPQAQAPAPAQPQPTPAPATPPASAEPAFRVTGAVTGGLEVGPGPAVKPTVTFKSAVELLGLDVTVVGGVKATFPPPALAPAEQQGAKAAAEPETPAAVEPPVVAEPAPLADSAARLGLAAPRSSAESAAAAQAAPHASSETPADAGKPPATIAAPAGWWRPNGWQASSWPEKLTGQVSLVRSDPAQSGGKSAAGVQVELEQGKGWGLFLTSGATQKNAVFDALNSSVKFKPQDVAPGLWRAARDGWTQGRQETFREGVQTFREAAAKAFATAEPQAGTDWALSDHAALNLTGKATVDKLAAPVAGLAAGAANVAGLVAGWYAGKNVGEWTQQNISAPLGLNRIQERAVATGVGGLSGLVVGAATQKTVEWGAKAAGSIRELRDFVAPAAKALAPLAETPAARWAGRILTRPGTWGAGALGAAFAAGPDALAAAEHFRNGESREGWRSAARSAIHGVGIGLGAGGGFFFLGGVGSVAGAVGGGIAADWLIQKIGLEPK